MAEPFWIAVGIAIFLGLLLFVFLFIAKTDARNQEQHRERCPLCQSTAAARVARHHE